MAVSKNDDGTTMAKVDTNTQSIAHGTTEIVTRRARLPWTKKNFFRSVLLQMILLGMLSLVGPAMSDAITNLGGGGLKKPWLANLSTSLSYSCSFICALFGGPLINKIGIKWSCFIAACAMPLHGSGFYTNSKFGTEWYLLFANIVKGSTAGFLYVAETTAMLSYPYPEDRGFYLGVWAAMRNSGSVIGGAINFGNNHDLSKPGGVRPSTYLIFVGCECTGVIWALLLSQSRKVRRRDGSKVPSSENMSWKQEFMALWQHYKLKRILLMIAPAFYSFFCGGTMGTYLSLHFSVRARALSSLLVPLIVIPTVVGYGRLLDQTWWGQKRRAYVGISMWAIPQCACYIWVAIEYVKVKKHAGLDYGLDSTTWIRAYFPYLAVMVTSYWCQLSMYWMLSTFSTDLKESSRSGGSFRAFETAGQAIAYGLNAGKIKPQIVLYVNIACLVAAIPCLLLLIRQISDRPIEGEAIYGDVVKDIEDEPRN